MLGKPTRWCISKLKREVINGYSLFLHLGGQPASPGPVMLMAHQDVVSGDRQPAEWTHPPFEKEIADGLIWGRGTLDIKIR